MCSVDLSVVIVNWNTGDYLKECLKSLQPWLKPEAPLKVEVLVVDNASSDGSTFLVQQDFPQVKLIANEENRGWAGGNNQGIQESRGRYILLLNPDTLLLPGSLDHLVQFLEDHPEAGAVAPKLLYPDGTVQPSLRSFPYPCYLFYDSIGLSRLFPKSRKFSAYRMGYFQYDKVVEVDQPMGSALLLRRSALEEVGLIDEDFPIFFNDVDWCYRAKQKGWKIYFLPEAQIIHYGGQSTRQVRPQMILESHRSLVRFYQKHWKNQFHPLVYWFLLQLIQLGMWIRWLRWVLFRG